MKSEFCEICGKKLAYRRTGKTCSYECSGKLSENTRNKKSGRNIIEKIKKQSEKIK